MSFPVDYFGRHILNCTAKTVRLTVQRLFGEAKVCESYMTVLGTRDWFYLFTLITHKIPSVT